jgi:CBS domain containing-hemolysin-like protein
MIGIISGYVLIVFGLLALTLQRLYSSVPAKELKRLARKGDSLAKALYRPVAYGVSLRLFLWFVVGVTLSTGLLIVLNHLPAYAGFMLLGLIMTIAFVWIPTTPLTVRKAQLAAWLAPALVKVLFYVHGPLDRAANFVGRYRQLPAHSRLYEKQDLVALVAQQRSQVDNRIQNEELELMERALAFTDKHAADVVQPRKKALIVSADDTIGPILLDQLHKSGQNFFLVYKDKKEDIIGSLSLADAVAAKQDGRVFDLIRGDLTFVNEDFTLRQVFTAFQKTNQHVAVVVNKFEEFVGVITLEGLMKELVGESEEEAVIHYDNRSEVAVYEPKANEESPALKEQIETAHEELTSPETTEVVE